MRSSADAGDWWGNFEDGVKCAFYKAKSNWDAVECAGQTAGAMIGKPFKAAMDDTTKVAAECGGLAIVGSFIWYKVVPTPGPEGGYIRYAKRNAYVILAGAGVCAFENYWDRLKGRV